MPVCLAQFPLFPPRRFRAAAWLLAGVTALPIAACQNVPFMGNAGPAAGSVAPSAKTEADWRREAETWGARYRANASDPGIALAYAKALRAAGQRAQSESVIEHASLLHPHDAALLGAYGRALADNGKYEQALEVLDRAHSPDQPDWRILSVQGAVLDQLGRHPDAQRYYASALKIKPDDPAVLSNLGLSYALAKDLKTAEATLRRAAALPGADQRVRQNLALVIGLAGRFAEAEAIARADLPAEEAAANVTYLRQMLAQGDNLRGLARQSGAASVPGT
jgi:Flp pilus assembly protein TadD